MKQIYIGLGNPGKQYENSRHNAGFLFIDFLLGNSKLSVKKEDDNSKLQSFISKVILDGNDYLFVKPQTFMNASGTAVRKLLDFYKYPAEGLVVIYDDLDIPFGGFKIHEGIGPRTHNGVLSIEAALQTKTFTQVRIGVDNPSTRLHGENARMSGEAYVLENFTEEEKNQLTDEVFPKVFAQLTEQNHI